MSKIIKTTDLWLILTNNEHERLTEYAKAFRAGFNADSVNRAITSSYDFYRIYLDCNCLLYCSDYVLPVCHTAIVFYQKQQPIRLLVGLSLTGVEACVNYAMPQRIGPYSLMEIFERSGVDHEVVDLKEDPCSSTISAQRPLISSCNRWDLFLQFIDNMKAENGPYRYNPNFVLNCMLNTQNEKFQIQHIGAFVNEQNNHCIAMQKESAIMT